MDNFDSCVLIIILTYRGEDAPFLQLLQSGFQVFIVQAIVSTRLELSPTNYNCSIPVTHQFSDKLKINPGRNKSATFRRQSLYLDNCFWSKLSVKKYVILTNLYKCHFRIVHVMITLTAAWKQDTILLDIFSM